jgi:Fe-Mn family superoxide dismutase
MSGSGSVLPAWSPRDRKLVNQWMALDMYEHLYQMDFGAKAASYVDTLMNVIRRNTAERLFVQMSEGTRGNTGRQA